MEISLFASVPPTLEDLFFHDLMEGGMTADKLLNIINNVAISCADDGATIYDNTPAQGRTVSGAAQSEDQQASASLLINAQHRGTGYQHFQGNFQWSYLRKLRISLIRML